MGSFSDVFESAVHAVSLGTIDMRDNPEVKTSATQELKEDAKDALKKRKALYETSGGVLGEDVMSVGTSSRGNIFGNR